jgi:hypothetical protein
MIAANAIISLSLILLIGLFIYGPWQTMCTDFTRQIIFEKRDAIFDIADRGDLSFQSREYRTIRSLLEGLIRFAHELTLPSFLFFWIISMRTLSAEERPALQRAIDGIRDENIKQEVRKLVDEAMKAVVLMMIVKSPVTLIALVPMAVVGGCVDLVRSGIRECARSIFRRSKIVIQFEAERVGSSTDTAVA